MLGRNLDQQIFIWELGPRRIQWSGFMEYMGSTCGVLILNAFSLGETPPNYVSFKKIRVTVWMALKCPPIVIAVHIPSQSIPFPANAQLLQCNGPQLPL